MTAATTTKRRRSRVAWPVAFASALAVLFVPLAIIEVRSGAETEIRVVTAGDRISADIHDGAHRVLIMNAVQISEARSALGRLSRPWDSKAKTVIAPGDDFAGTGLWEALQTIEPQQVIVLGAPGDGQSWSMIEQLSRQEGFDLRYITEDTVVQLDQLTLTLLAAPEADKSRPAVIVRHGDINVAIALGEEVPPIDAQVIVSGTMPPAPVDLLITNRRPQEQHHQAYIFLGPADRVDVAFEGDQVRVSGGEITVNR